MNTPCLTCANLKLKEYPKFAAVGLGRCMKGPGAYFVGIGWDRPCTKHSPLVAEKAEARRVWWLQKRDKGE